MADFENKRVISLFNPTEIRKRLSASTIAICGSSRGGTSLAAFAMFNMGLHLGDRIGVLNYEDQDLLAALEDKERFLEIAAKRNAEHKRWGFKIPAAVRHIEWMASSLRNPIFVVVYRNPLAIARSILNRDPNAAKNLTASISHGLTYMQQATSALQRSNAPAVLVDFERAGSEPNRFIAELCEALEIQVGDGTSAWITDAVKRGDYSTSPRRENVAFV